MLGRRIKTHALGISAVLLVVSTVPLATIGATNASAAPAARTATPALRAAAPPPTGACYWQNASANPFLYIRDTYSTSGNIVGEIPYKAFFNGSCNFDNGFIFVDSAGYPRGWVNHIYCVEVIVAGPRSPGLGIASGGIASRG